MKILVIDDSQEQRDMAAKLLAGHELTIVGTCREAIDNLLNKDASFDVVLTDLMMPSEWDRVDDKFIAYGLTIALLALKRGIKKIAIISNGQADDGNHHNHPILSACDLIIGTIIEGRLMAFVGYQCPHMDEEQVPDLDKPWNLKDWATVLAVIMGEKTWQY